MRRYAYHLADQDNRPRTVRGCFDALRFFGAFLVQAEANPDNPARNVTLPKPDAAVRLIVTDADVEALFVAAERQRTLRLVVMSRAVLWICLRYWCKRAIGMNLAVE